MIAVCDKIVIAKGDSTQFSGTAIVNAANTKCLGGGGVDRAITTAGGKELYEARKKLPDLGNGVRCPTGDAKLTTFKNSHKLKCNHVIHAVGPNFNTIHDKEKAEELLESASAMEIANTQSMSTIGFPLISAGEYRHKDIPLKEVISIGLEAIKKSLDADSPLKYVVVIAYTKDYVNAVKDTFEKMFTAC